MNAFSPPADTGSLSLNAVRKGLVNSLRTFQALLLSCDAGLSLEVGTSEGKTNDQDRNQRVGPYGQAGAAQPDRRRRRS